MFKTKIKPEEILITNKLIYDLCEDFIKKELTRIPDQIERESSTIHCLSIFDLSKIANSKNRKILEHLLTPTTLQLVSGRLKLLVRELYCRLGIIFINECIAQVEYSLKSEKDFPIKEYYKLKKQYSVIWVLPYIQMVYNHIL